MSDDRRVDFRDLNWMGKTVYLGGSALRLTARLIDSAVDRAGRIAEESKRAYDRELDPNIEDAKVLSEEAGRPVRPGEPSVSDGDEEGSSSS